MAWNAKFTRGKCWSCSEPLIAGQYLHYVTDPEGRRHIEHEKHAHFGASKKQRRWNNGHFEPAKVAGRIAAQNRRRGTTPPSPEEIFGGAT